MDDSQFLGSIMGESARQGPAEQQGALVTAPLVVPKKRGRPPKTRDGSAVVAPPAKPAKRRENEEEVVCFICFDGGNLVVCDRRGCPKVYHPPCIKRDESFFNSRSKWNCGWHICSSCEKAVHYMCYTCTYSLCKMCIKQGKFFAVRGAKGFCDTCFGTILLIESKDEAATKLQVDFDDINSWEYLFKLYWLDLKGKLSLTLEELTSAKSRWTVPNTCSRKEKDESSDDLYDINNEDDTGFDCSSRKRRQTNSSRKKGRKRQKVNLDCSIAPKKVEPAIRDDGSLARKVPTNGVSLPVDTKWASPELLEFVGHMKDGDQSFMSQFDVQTLLLEYIKKNNLRDPQRKSQIICDARLHCFQENTCCSL
jgi:chromatin remodeling complex protein RSC6